MESSSKLSFNTFTILFDFKGGTYISQIRADSPQTALISWSEALEIDLIPGLGKKTKKQIIEEAISEDVVSLNTLTNVWCAWFLLRKSSGLVNIVKTDIE